MDPSYVYWESYETNVITANLHFIRLKLPKFHGSKNHIKSLVVLHCRFKENANMTSSIILNTFFFRQSSQPDGLAIDTDTHRDELLLFSQTQHTTHFQHGGAPLCRPKDWKYFREQSVMISAAHFDDDSR